MLGNGAVNTFLQQQINIQQQRELLEAVFSVWYVPRLYSNDQQGKLVSQR
jgi:hypothetical protein